MVRVVNWRCIEDLTIELSNVTIFVGKNSSGKSSLAYAVYFISKIPQWRDPIKLLLQLYGEGLDTVARRGSDGKPSYPVIVEVDNVRFVARSRNEHEVPSSSPWSDSYLLPSQRISFVRLALLLSKAARRMFLEEPSVRATLLFIGGIIELMKSMPMVSPLPLFLSDYMRMLTGRSYFEEIEVANLGKLLMRVHTLLSLLELDYQDPYTDLRLPLDQAPDGFVDSILLTQVVERAPKRSLIVVEEPENHKNPMLLIDLVKRIAVNAVEKDLTIVMTTHSDILLQAIAKAVEEKLIRHSNVAVYHLERCREYPWSAARRLNVYEDGTMDPIPDSEKVVAALF